MAVSSGLSGSVNGFDTVRSWRVTESDAGPNFVASNSDGMQGSLAGNVDWTGSISLYGYAPAFLPGEAVTFAGWNGTSRFSAEALVSGVSLECDIEGGGVLNHSIEVAGNGASTKNTSSVTDSAVPAAYTSIGCKASFDAAGGSSYTDIADVRNWSLSLACAMQQYVSSSTAGIVKRKPGPLSGRATVGVYQDTVGTLPTVGTIGSLRLYVSASAYYQLLYARVVSIEPATDVEGGGLNAATIQYEYTGFKRITGTMTKGSITKPDTTVYWN